LPVAVLDITEAQAETFGSWGTRNVAALAALPEQSLIARLGQDAMRLLQLANGTHPHLFQPIAIPFVLEEQVELALSHGFRSMLAVSLFNGRPQVAYT